MTDEARYTIVAFTMCPGCGQNRQVVSGGGFKPHTRNHDGVTGPNMQPGPQARRVAGMLLLHRFCAALHCKTRAKPKGDRDRGQRRPRPDRVGRDQEAIRGGGYPSPRRVVPLPEVPGGPAPGESPSVPQTQPDGQPATPPSEPQPGDASVPIRYRGTARTGGVPMAACRVCGDLIRIMVYKGTGWCSENCRKALTAKVSDG
jgi:hypothetical protein